MMNGVGTVHKRNLKKCMDLFVHDALSDNSSEKKKGTDTGLLRVLLLP